MVPVMQPECRWAVRGFLTALLAALGGCGCAGRTVTTAPSRWQGVTVRVSAPEGRPQLVVKRLGGAWANGVGATLSVVPATGDWPAADLVLVPAPDLPRWAAAGKATPLPKPEDVDNFMPLYRTRLLVWDNTPYALPVLGDAPVCVYRRDLYADPAAKQAYREQYKRPLDPPETWDEFADQAEFFAKRRARPSLPPLPADDAGVVAAFGAVAAPYAVKAVPVEGGRTREPPSERVFSFQYDAVTGQPRLAEPGFVEALTLFKRLRPHRASTPSVAEALRADQAVLGHVTLADLGAIGPDEAKRWGVFRAPGTRVGGGVNAVPYVGAGAVVGIVPKDAAQPEAAFDLLGSLSGPDASTELVHDQSIGSGPFRDRHVDQRPEGWLNYGLAEDQTRLLRTFLREVADPRVENPALALRIPPRTPHVAALAAEVRAALAGGDPAAALRSAAEKWRQLDGDPAKARADYRRSVGLAP
jgi:multiple sugar transport system substrate-binding protein